MHNGIVFHICLLLFSIFWPCQQDIDFSHPGASPKELQRYIRMRDQFCQVNLQWKRRWLLVSIASSHKIHLLQREQPLLCNATWVTQASFAATQPKQASLGASFVLHNIFQGQLFSQFFCPEILQHWSLLQLLMEVLPDHWFLPTLATILSSSFLLQGP